MCVCVCVYNSNVICKTTYAPPPPQPHTSIPSIGLIGPQFFQNSTIMKYGETFYGRHSCTEVK